MSDDQPTKSDDDGWTVVTPDASAVDADATDALSWDEEAGDGATAGEAAGEQRGETAGGQAASGRSSPWGRVLLIELLAAPLLFVSVVTAAGLQVQYESQVLLALVVASAAVLVSLRIAFPVTLYLDARQLGAGAGNSGPRVAGYAAVTLLAPPPFEIIAVIIYLLRRRKYTVA